LSYDADNITVILGHGIVYCIVAGSALLGELGHPKERAFLGSYFNAFYYVGSVTAAGVVLETLAIKSDWSWRLPSVLQAAPSLIQLATIYFIPESPRWLISKDRADEALEILIKYHAEGDHNAELPRVEFAQIKTALEIEDASRKRGWLELFQSPGMRRRSLIGAMLGLFTQFSGNSLITSYLVMILRLIGWTNAKVQNQLNVGIQGWSLVCAMTLASVVAGFPRRRIYLLCASCLLMVYTAWTIAQSQAQTAGNSAAGGAVIAMMFLYWPAYIIGYNALTYVYLVELFPFYVRTKGISWFQ
jgi:MFS family permease